MREIKFRGRSSKDNKTWFTGSLVSLTDIDEAYIDHYDGLRRVIERYPVDPDTVGQFTGLHDADGREIYEGDVLNNLYGRLGVSYKQKWAAFVVCGVDKTGYYHEYLLDKIVNTPVRRSEIKVIGNIHDDPGLLEG